MTVPGDLVTSQAACESAFLWPVIGTLNGHYTCLSDLAPGAHVLDVTLCTAAGMAAHPYQIGGTATVAYQCTQVPAYGDTVEGQQKAGEQLCAREGYGVSPSNFTASASAYYPSQTLTTCANVTSTYTSTWRQPVIDSPLETTATGIRTDVQAGTTTAHTDATAAQGASSTVSVAPSQWYVLIAVLAVAAALLILFAAVRTARAMFS